MTDDTKGAQDGQSPVETAKQLDVDSAAWTGMNSAKTATAMLNSNISDQNALAAASTVPPAAPVPANDVRPEVWMLDDIESYLKDARTRFASVLTGMATSTHEMIVHLENAVIHMRDHIEQITSKKEG